ncbi:TerD domain-containing protein [Streptomyces sp. DvalAA-19]|nr:TerD domain-containing protein [Streptomyces sp. DvalAA-19]
MAREFQRGHKAKLSDLTPGTDLYVGVQIAAPGLTFDISCFGLDANEQLSDDRYFIFFNQPKSPEESIQLLGAQSGDTESFRVTLDRIPAAIQKLSFTATIDGPGQMSQVGPRVHPDRRRWRRGGPVRLHRIGVHHRARGDAR